MQIAINMPYSTLNFVADDDSKLLQKIKKHLTFPVRTFNSFGPPSIRYECLLESSDNTQFRFRTGLLHKITDWAEINGIDVQLIDLRSMPDKMEELEGRKVELRDYQEELVNKLLEQDMAVMDAATGAGKTNMAAAMIARKQVSCLFNVHTIDLLRQTKQRFEELLRMKVGVVGAGEFNVLPVTVSTVQTLYKLHKDGLLNFTADMIIQDECHHIPASMFYAVTGAFRSRYVYGLSATPSRSDGTGMMIEAACGPVAAKIDTDELIEKGYLSKVDGIFNIIKAEMSTSKAPRYAIINKYLVKFQPRNEKIAEIVKAKAAEGKSVLVAVNYIKHGEILRDMIPGSELLHGKDDKQTREKTIQGLRDKSVNILISTLMKEGVDVPSLDVVVNAFGGSDPTQLIGRALRVADGKDKAEYIDFIDNQHDSLHRASMSRLRKCKKIKSMNIRME